jgi:glycosyltransferase involved in cell wall biosynthesis
MRGAAISMAGEVRMLASAREQADLAAGAIRRPAFDLIFASTFLNLAEFRGLVGADLAAIPAIVYFHENQLVYPNRHTAEWDFQFPLTNITSALSAERCVFNTHWNLDRFCEEIPDFIREFPDHHPKGLAEAIAAKSSVLAPPFDPSPFDAVPPTRADVCRIVWPHRWEHDKDPEAFFSAVMELAGEGLDFEVAVAGQSFRETEGLMRQAAAALGTRLVHCDEPGSREAYAEVLASADVAVSTATNEFFGLAMIEACYAGATPVVPDRLAYPEIYPAEMRYRSQDGLVAQLRSHITHRPAPGVARGLAQPFTFERLVIDYERLFAEVAEG